MKGTITAVQRTKGFGFIRDEEGRDRFFHIKELVGADFQTVTEGTRVDFEPYDQQGNDKNNGLRARSVRVEAA